MKSKLAMIFGLLTILIILGCQLDIPTSDLIDQTTDDTTTRAFVPTHNGFPYDCIWWGISDRYNPHIFYVYVKYTDLQNKTLGIFSSKHFTTRNLIQDNYNMYGYARFRVTVEITFDPEDDPDGLGRTGYLFAALDATRIDYMVIYIC